MKLSLPRNSYFFFLVLAFFIAELIINPLGNFPLNDDWSYVQALKTFYTKDVMFIGTVPAMTLATQIVWGFLFTHAFGFSFFVLRCSTIVATLIGLYFLYRLLLQVGRNHKLAFWGCMVILFNPLVFNLTNTFMTDVNFNTLIVICSYLAYNFMHTRRWHHYVLFVLLGTALVLLRQYGIIVPACFVAASLFLKEKRIKVSGLSLLAFAIIFAALKWYEHYLGGILPPGADYQFSGKFNLLSGDFWEKLYASFESRRREIMLHLLAYPMPFAAVFIPSLIKRANRWLTVSSLIVAGAMAWMLAHSDGITSPSTLMNTMLGNEIFHESISRHHNESLSFGETLNAIKCISSGITLFVLLLGLALTARTPAWRSTALKPDVLFFVLLVLAYAFMILITESYFDRYHIPLITLLVILLSWLARDPEPKLAVGLLPWLFWAYIAVAGTKDYLQWNRLKWEAYWYLRRDLHIPADKIHGGIDVVGWNEGNGFGWRDIRLNNFSYVIQFTPEEDFTVPLKYYEFQRYYPYKKDKIYIFVRQDQRQLKHDQ